MNFRLALAREGGDAGFAPRGHEHLVLVCVTHSGLIKSV